MSQRCPLGERKANANTAAMIFPSDKPTEPHSPVKPDPSFPSFVRHGAWTVLTLLCFAASLSHAAELGALVRRQSWHTLPFKFSPFNEGGAGIVTDSAADG